MWWFEHTCAMMRICVFGNVRIRARWISPYALRNVRWEFRDWMWIFCRVFAILFQSVSNVISRPLAAVGADLSCPHIRIYPQNDEQKCVCDETNMRIWWCENAFAMKWICVFDDVKIRIWQCKDTGTMNRSPTPTECTLRLFTRKRTYPLQQTLCNILLNIFSLKSLTNYYSLMRNAFGLILFNP